MTHPMSHIPSWDTYVAPPRTPATPKEGITEEKIKNLLELRATGKPLQRKWCWHYNVAGSWVDIPTNTPLSSLMQWLIQGMEVRVAPPKPRESWRAELNGLGVSYYDATYLTGASFPSKETCDAAWRLHPGYLRAIKFVEVLD